MDWDLVSTSANKLHIRIEVNPNTSNQVNQDIGGYIFQLYSGWRRSAPFCERLRNRRIVAFGTTYEAICPTVFDGDMTVI